MAPRNKFQKQCHISLLRDQLNVHSPFYILRSIVLHYAYVEYSYVQYHTAYTSTSYVSGPTSSGIKSSSPSNLPLNNRPLNTGLWGHRSMRSQVYRGLCLYITPEAPPQRPQTYALAEVVEHHVEAPEWKLDHWACRQRISYVNGPVGVVLRSVSWRLERIGRVAEDKLQRREGGGADSRLGEWCRDKSWFDRPARAPFLALMGVQRVTN